MSLMAAGPAAAQAKLDAQYRVTLGGLPIGNGAWVVDVTQDQYAMAVTGKASGLLQVLSSGNGHASARGTIHGGRLTSTQFSVFVKARNKTDEIKMRLAAGAVKSVSIEPPPKPPSGPRVPLTEAHKRGIIDPISAGIVPRENGGALGPEVCKRTVPVFDGRQRFDLSGSFKRIEQVKSEKGYEGPVVVCAVQYTPIAGHDPERFANKFLRESRDIEVWYAPINGTRFVAVYRASVPTTFGPAVMQATRFVAVPRDARASLGATGQ
jgi:hypothetical protein